MARYWNGYQWRELADDRPREPELQPEPEPVRPLEGSRLSRSMKPTRREESMVELSPQAQRAFEKHHTHYFENDVCACGAKESDG